ncbi:MAG: ACT domain-containing protein [Desulfofustis sp.]|jgi:uncharacterized protein
MKLELDILEESVSIHRFCHDSTIPLSVYRSSFFSISRTAEELSVVCDSSIRLQSDKSETGWKIIKVCGPLDFSETGVLAALTDPLAAAKIAVFAVSTFDTDYILIKPEHMAGARNVLERAGFRFVRS